jgi:aminoglycoside phosphotransferase (APT) family kinase protein
MKDVHYPVAHRDQSLIDSFKSRYDDFDEEMIPGIIKDAIGITPIEVEKSSSWGSAHVIYYLKFNDHRDLVFRANINIPEPEIEMLTEKLITDLVDKQGIATNKIIYVDISRKKYNFDFTIQERLGGIDPEDEFNGTKEEYDQFNFETGQAIAKLSQIKLTGFGRFNTEKVKAGILEGDKDSISDYLEVCLDEDLEALIKFKVISEKQFRLIQNFFEQRKALINIKQGSLVHYDLADHNLRYGSGGHLDSIFDWETAVVASPILDLASCPTWKSHYPKREKLIEGYKSILPLPDNFEEAESVYLLRTMIWKMRYVIRADLMNEERARRLGDTLDKLGING